MNKQHQQALDMAFWGGTPYQAEDDRDPGFFWHDDSLTPGEGHPGAGGVVGGDGVDDTSDLFGQFVNFDDHHPSAVASNGFMSMSMGLSSAAPTSLGMFDEGSQTNVALARGLEDPFLLDQQSDSLGSSTADELDFLSSSTDVDATGSSVYDVDPRTLAATKSEPLSTNIGDYRQQQFGQYDYLARGASVSDIDLPRLEGITLSSPTKKVPSSLSQPPSPTPPKSTAGTTRNKASRFVEAVGATIRKAAATAGTTRGKKQRKPLPPTRPDSPTFDDQIRAPRQRARQNNGGRRSATVGGGSIQHSVAQTSVPRQAVRQDASGNFIMGPYDDPFHDAPPLPPPASAMRYYQQEGVSPPLMSPAIKTEPGSFQLDHVAPHENVWQPAPGTALTANDHWDGARIVSANEAGTPVTANPAWWEYNQLMAAQNGASDMDLAAMQAQQAELAYEYTQQPFQDTGTTGLMIQIPHPPQGLPLAVRDANPSPRTQMPPHTMSLPPPPPAPAADRQHRPPKAPSSGARHLSHSPVRRPRAPSASPTRTHPGTHSRHSSGGSVGSARSASGGRLPASMPGTPCSVRKRRSREASGSGGASHAAASSSSDNVGFVNFTPHDGGMLMTGVAPSGSSKTKARREKEAADRRKKMNEAAIRAVAAAGGDVERLMQQGFAF